MLKSIDEGKAREICFVIEEFISSDYPPECTKLYYKLFYQAFSDPHFSMTEDEKIAMEKISDLLMLLWEAKNKQKVA